MSNTNNIWDQIPQKAIGIGIGIDKDQSWFWYAEKPVPDNFPAPY